MRIAIPALGTLGDVLPYVRLGHGLNQAGHDVTVYTTERFRALVEQSGLDFRKLPGDPEVMFDAVAFDPYEISPLRPLRHVRVIHRGLNALVGEIEPERLLEAWRDVDFVVFGPTTTFGAINADALGVGRAMLAMTPTVATGAFPHPVLAPTGGLGRWGNRATWLAGERLQRQTYKEPLRPATRAAHGLPKIPLSAPKPQAQWPPFPVLHAYSASVVPRPVDWPAHVEVTGWLLPEPSSDPLPEPVERFLDAGEPPVYIGFGSMPLGDPERMGALLLRTLTRTGNRAIVSGSGLRSAAALHEANSVLMVDDIDHDRLFQRVAAVIHHGGSGTVGSGLRAGRPTLVVPLVFDQFFWGRLVHALGAGPPPIPLGRLSEEKLRRALTELAAPSVRRAAGNLGDKIAAEAGQRRAVASIERMLTA